MFLESPWYETTIARLIDILCISEPDQVIGRILVFILDGVVQSSVSRA